MSIALGSAMHHVHTFPLPPDFMIVDEIERERVRLLENLESVVTFLKNYHSTYPSTNPVLDRAAEARFFDAGVVGPMVTMIENIKASMRGARNNIIDSQRFRVIRSMHMCALSSLTRMPDKTGFCAKQLIQIANLTYTLLNLEVESNGFVSQELSSGRDHVIDNLRNTLRSQGTEGLNCLASPSIAATPLQALSSSSSMVAANSSRNQPTTNNFNSNYSSSSTVFNFNFSNSERRPNYTNPSTSVVISLRSSNPERRRDADIPSSSAMRSEGGRVENLLNARDKGTIDEGLKRKSIADRGTGETCPVCLEEIKGRDEAGIATMGCSHTFHFNCIFKWMKSKNTCPLCRYDINPDKRRRR